MKTKALLFILLLIAGCTPPNKPMSETEKQATLKEAQTAVKEMFDALAVNDMDKMSGMVDSGQDMSYIFGEQLMNYGGMMDLIKQMFPAVEKQTFETKTEKYIILDPSNFLYSWNGKNGMIMKSGVIVMYNNLFGTFLFRKSDGKWKFLYGHEAPGVAVLDSTGVKK